MTALTRVEYSISERVDSVIRESTLSAAQCFTEALLLEECAATGGFGSLLRSTALALEGERIMRLAQYPGWGMLLLVTSLRLSVYRVLSLKACHATPVIQSHDVHGSKAGG